MEIVFIGHLLTPGPIYFSDGGTIAGIVIGSLIGLAVFVSLVVCLCSACTKSAGATGRVVQPTPSVAIVTQTNTGTALLNTQTIENAICNIFVYLQ